MSLSPYWSIIADVHAGYCPANLPVREQDFYASYQRQCRLAADDPNCLGVIGIGDLRDKPSLQAKNLDGFNAGIEILHNAKKVLLGIIGNHDFTVPNWIQAMRHPGLQDLTLPAVQKEHGMFDEILALHYLNRDGLLARLTELGREKIETIKQVFLHLALAELAGPQQKCEISLEELHAMGFGTKVPCTVFIGDLHNYGDVKIGDLEAVYPGSLEMTDRNEGVNGLKSARYPQIRPDFTKYILHWYPKGKDGNGISEWERIPINPRPWHYAKVQKTKKGNTELVLENAQKAVTTWNENRPGQLTLILPPKEVEGALAIFKKPEFQKKILFMEIEAFSKEIHGDDEQEEEPTITGTASWPETKQTLLQMAKEEELPARSIELLESIIAHDRSTNSAKQDIATAWSKWKKASTPEEPSEDPAEETSAATAETQPTLLP